MSAVVDSMCLECKGTNGGHFPSCSKLGAYVGKKGANSVQHGGTHYKTKAIEPWDYVAANNLGFFEGTAIKYLTRWRDKGGIEDLKKARHYIDKLIEIEATP